MEMIELKKYSNKNLLGRLSRRNNMTEERISELENRKIEIIQSEQQRENNLKKHGQSIRDLWDNNKTSKIFIVRAPEGEEK